MHNLPRGSAGKADSHYNHSQSNWSQHYQENKNTFAPTADELRILKTGVFAGFDSRGCAASP